MSRVQVIRQSLAAIGGKTYMEIGVFDGSTFALVDAALKIAIDPLPPAPLFLKDPAANIKYYQTTSDDFFLNHSGVLATHGLDVAFIDGVHSYQQVLRDVENCLRFLNQSGIIVMHDCNPATPEMMLSCWSGDAWKTIVHLRSTRSDLRVFVLNSDFGLGIVCYGKPENLLSFTPEAIEAMSYWDLADNRAAFLNLKSFDSFDDFISNYPFNVKI